MSTHEENDFKCDKCLQSFKWKHHLQRHVKTVHTTKQFQCELCEFSCSRKESLNRHIDTHTKTKSQVIKRKAANSASNAKKRIKYYVDDHIFESDDEDQI